jgi:hypothetical protein
MVAVEKTEGAREGLKREEVCILWLLIHSVI